MPTKADIRLRIKRLRQNLDSEWIFRQSSLIHHHLFDWAPWSDFRNIGCYISFGAEVDTRAIMKRAVEENKKMWAPLYHEGRYHWVACDPDNLTEGPMGIFQPNGEPPEQEPELDLILVPGLAFDSHGTRIGFGQGHIDRLLSDSSAIKAALAFDFQLLSQLPAEDHDIPMDYIVHQKGILQKLRYSNET